MQDARFARANPKSMQEQKKALVNKMWKYHTRPQFVLKYFFKPENEILVKKTHCVSAIYQKTKQWRHPMS